MVILIATTTRPKVLQNIWRMFLSPIQRCYEDEDSNILQNTLLTLFQGGTLALVTLVSMTAIYGINGIADIRHFGQIIALIAGVWVGKIVLMKYIHYTFALSMQWSDWKKHYTSVWMMFCLVGFIYLLAAPYLSLSLRGWIPCCLLVVYIISVAWKVIPSFSISIKNSLYLLLYFVHLEVLPIALVAWGTYLIVA